MPTLGPGPGQEARTGLFESINAFALQLFAIGKEADLYWYVAREVVGNLGFDDCVIYELDRSRSLLVQAAAIGAKNPSGETIANRLEIPLGQGITGSVAQKGEAAIVSDLTLDPRYIPDLEPARSEICVPLLIDRKVVGVIDCEHPEPDRFGEQELVILTSVAAMASAKLRLLADTDETLLRNRELSEINRRLKAEMDARREAEHAVRTRETWLRAILENAPIEIALKDRRGRIMAISRNVAQDQGRTLDDFVGKTTEELIPPEVAATYMAADRLVVEEGRPLQQAVTEDWEGHKRHFLNEKFPLRDDSGEIIGVCSLTSDMTQLKEAEQRLHQAQKMEAIGKLTGGIAHDVNNLLAVIQGNAELILDEQEHAQDYVDAIVQATGRGADLTQRLLAFARQQPLRPQPTAINRLVEETTTLLRRTLGPAITIETDLPGDLWTTSVDPGQIENVILNLALNARDAMPDGGRLSIDCFNYTLEEDYLDQKEVVAAGDYVCLDVDDNGCGMDATVMQRAFEPFFTTKEVGKGSGLGLSMVYGFAKQSGGHATIASSAGVGTKVRLYLPRWEGKASLLHRETTQPLRRGRGQRVLIVDDEGEMRALAERQVNGLGYRATVVHDTASAIAAITGPRSYDLLLSDILLGETTTGLDLARQVRSLVPNIAVVLMSGFQAGQDGTPAGSIRLKKPFRRNQLAKALGTALDRRAQQPEHEKDTADAEQDRGERIEEREKMLIALKQEHDLKGES